MLKIITDSSAEISQEEARALGIEVVPLTVVFGAEAFLDGVELTKEDFYKRLLSGEFPHTSQPSQEQFFEAFTRTGGEETLVLLISSALSGTTNAARLAKEEGGFTRVHIYETLCTTAMLRILVEAAVQNREKSADEVVAILDELRPRIRLCACVDTLEYLRKGGRIKRSVAFVGDLLGIKPIVGVSREGTVVMTGRAHGQKKALQALANEYLSARTDPAYPVYFLRTEPETPACELMKAVGREGRVFRICCAVGAHIGPNAAGIVFVAAQENG